MFSLGFGKSKLVYLNIVNIRIKVFIIRYVCSYSFFNSDMWYNIIKMLYVKVLDIIIFFLLEYRF